MTKPCGDRKIRCSRERVLPPRDVRGSRCGSCIVTSNSHRLTPSPWTRRAPVHPIQPSSPRSSRTFRRAEPIRAVPLPRKRMTTAPASCSVAVPTGARTDGPRRPSSSTSRAPSSVSMSASPSPISNRAFCFGSAQISRPPANEASLSTYILSTKYPYLRRPPIATRTKHGIHTSSAYVSGDGGAYSTRPSTPIARPASTIGSKLGGRRRRAASTRYGWMNAWPCVCHGAGG